MKKAIKITLIIVGILAVLLIGAVLVFSQMIAPMIYNDNFGKRFTTYEPFVCSVEEFDGLIRDKYTFESNKGQLLTGYRYYKNDTEAKALMVFAHGFGGGGHNSYMSVINYFADNGFTVFAYDATGNDESEGEAVGGLPQGIIDLDYALRFVKENEDFSGMPIVLWGHSWGAYSVGNAVALHPDVKAAVMVAGFNKSIDVIEAEGRNMAGDAVEMVLEDMEKLEAEKFGEYASLSCSESLGKTSAGIMILHSTDDDMIPKAISYDVLFEKYGSDPRFEFLEFANRGHNYFWVTDDARETLIEQFDKSRFNELDEELMSQMLEFYVNNIN